MRTPQALANAAVDVVGVRAPAGARRPALHRRFRTGFSSLNYLRKLPVHQLKIDRSFVLDLAHDQDARAVVAAIVQLAHALRMKVVAEGVETSAQHDVLQDIGIDKFPGLSVRQTHACRHACAMVAIA